MEVVVVVEEEAEDDILLVMSGEAFAFVNIHLRF